MMPPADGADNSRRIGLPRDCSFASTDWEVLSRSWFPIACSEELGTKPISARLLDTDLVVYRNGATVRVARDLCFHRGAALSLGWVEGDMIICPYHGFHYGPDGRCLKVPAHPDMPISSKLRLIMFPAVERYGLIWTTLNGDAEDLPAFEAWDDPNFKRIMAPTVDIKSSAGRQLEGFLDVSHFAWAHADSFGDRSNPIVPSYRVERTSYGLHAEYLSKVSNYPKPHQHLAPSDFGWLRVFDVFPPFSARLIVHYPEGGRLWLLNAASPVSSRMTRLFGPMARNFSTDAPIEEIQHFKMQILEEDRIVVESQHPEDLPLDLQMEAHITADRTSIAYRRILKEAGLGAVYVS